MPPVLVAREAQLGRWLSMLTEVEQVGRRRAVDTIVVGPRGVGKTVLLEAIAGAFPLEAGSILLDGKDIRCLPVQQRRLGIVYQDHALFPHMTVAENIGYGLRMARCRPCALPTSCSRASSARR